MSKSKPVQSKEDTERLRKSLLSIGVDKSSVEELISSRELSRAIVPIYWKDGIVLKANSFWLPTLPEFLKDFTREFPDGQVRWDTDYHGEKPGDGDLAISVVFNYQGDDQGDHWSPKPDTPEEESYYRMIKRSTFKGDKAVPATRIIHGR